MVRDITLEVNFKMVLLAHLCRQPTCPVVTSFLMTASCGVTVQKLTSPITLSNGKAVSLSYAWKRMVKLNIFWSVQ